MKFYVHFHFTGIYQFCLATVDSYGSHSQQIKYKSAVMNYYRHIHSIPLGIYSKNVLLILHKKKPVGLIE